MSGCTCADRRSDDNRIRQDMPDGFTRIISYVGAHHCERMDANRNDPKSHGIGSGRLWFIFLGPKGATQWLLDTGWYLGQDQRHGGKPDAHDLGYHAREPQWEGQEPMGNCDLWDGPCYYDGSGLNAMPHVQPFLRDGPAYIWRVLREDYDSRFGILEQP